MASGVSAGPAAGPGAHLRLSEAEKNLVEALAGALGAVCATWVFYPLDTVKTRLQAAVVGEQSQGDSLASVGRHLLATEGPQALYAGVGLKTVHSVVQNFVYFYAFARLRSRAEAVTGGKLGVAATLAVGTLAGWCNVLLTEPLDTVVTAKQTKARPLPRLKSAAEQAAAADAAAAATEPAEGQAADVKPQAAPAPHVGLYRSIWVSLLLTCNPAIQFTAFDHIRRRLLAARGGPKPELTALDAFVLGAASKAFATVLTYPAIRAKVLIQTGRSGCSTLVEAGSRVVQQEGPGGLYRGLRAQLLKTVLVSALQLMVKEKSFGAAYAMVRAAKEGHERRVARRAGRGRPSSS